MKNTSKFILSVLFLLLAVQFTSACNSNINNRHNIQDTNDGVIFIEYSDDNHYDNYWENEDRYPTYDYRNGYTYRITNEYREIKEVRDRYNDNYYNNRYSNKRVFFQDTPNYYYEYSDYMREYQKHECYNYPPSDKLFYAKCP